jgi:hypothetical protein
MEENKSCYQFKLRTYENVLFNNVDATYIIHLKNNGRESSIEEQLSHYQPTHLVYLVENQGYKKCQKNLHEYKPAYDLTDAFLQTFRHAASHHYNHILILEDDFLFTPSPTLQTSCTEIDDFLQTRGNKFIYYLGSLPYLQSTGFSNHNQLYLSTGSHACIYSKSLRTHILEDYKQSEIIDWDAFHTMNLWHYPRYIYHQPLCYQLFPPTENSKHWYNPFGFARLVKFTHSMVGVDKQVEPGYSRMYLFSKSLYVLMCLYLMYLISQFVGSGKKRRIVLKRG